ncbi:hypothetical protein OE88DRAFT_1654171 [Heliocybe sulcata]|uniref:Uncharacterized protein n=1 Tax=Heliocybe sulcata TaxID=5364 RepID=A0A5C3NDA6_9AGAM|nr:hypothetical protein OE88DRAFT_1654171 [Heliocybe sulcata]
MGEKRIKNTEARARSRAPSAATPAPSLVRHCPESGKRSTLLMRLRPSRFSCGNVPLVYQVVVVWCLSWPLPR